MYGKLNQYLSNLAVLNVKLHNLHWNVVGLEFVQVHEFTESLYDDFFEKYDAVAELMKMREENPLVTMEDYLKNSSINELKENKFSPAEVLEIVKDDLSKMRDLAIEIRNLADEANDFVIVGEFEGHVADYDKNLWFLKAMLTK
ncbi:DNA starvation/stationary phase protection protein [Irregularibacter muris]|uniref:DNA starvation/stationary phase protection protein n=1 Tax=Irregularibacter muris TaxID=1796619 RepID=A0AAE3L2D6_9FIRM|nr:DNA starvation/stationary phase protection protein [Irregularibacter muris]MCR1898319.1 DNA starvation/stationary phase protection protein [Irregularibacter muris]